MEKQKRVKKAERVVKAKKVEAVEHPVGFDPELPSGKQREFRV